jgi:hypothetical protein
VKFKSCFSFSVLFVITALIRSSSARPPSNGKNPDVTKKLPPTWISVNKTDCSVWDSAPLKDETAVWDGKCVGSPARIEGPGTLTWFSSGVKIQQQIGTWNSGKEVKTNGVSRSIKNYYPNGNVKNELTTNANKGTYATFLENGDESTFSQFELESSGEWVCSQLLGLGFPVLITTCRTPFSFDFKVGAPFTFLFKDGIADRYVGVINSTGSPFPGKMKVFFIDGSSMVVLFEKDGTTKSKELEAKVIRMREKIERERERERERKREREREQERERDERKREREREQERKQDEQKREEKCNDLCASGARHCKSNCGNGNGASRDNCMSSCSSQESNCRAGCVR